MCQDTYQGQGLLLYCVTKCKVYLPDIPYRSCFGQGYVIKLSCIVQSLTRMCGCICVANIRQVELEDDAGECIGEVINNLMSVLQSECNGYNATHAFHLQSIFSKFAEAIATTGYPGMPPMRNQQRYFVLEVTQIEADRTVQLDMQGLAIAISSFEGLYTPHCLIRTSLLSLANEYPPIVWYLNKVNLVDSQLLGLCLSFIAHYRDCVFRLQASASRRF